MKSHDWQNCIFCQFQRGLLVVGMSAMAIIAFIFATEDAFHGQWSTAGREYLCVPICLGAAWLGLKLLKALNEFFDWLFNKIEAKFQ